jgi:hypothetical protein
MSKAARLGAFVVGTLVILALGVFIIGSKQYLFSSTYELKTQFDNVVGLDAGADVRVGGVHVGTVRNILLPHKPAEKVTVIVDVDKSTHEVIKQDSVASIETEGVVGQPASGDLVWIRRDSRRTGWRFHRQPATTRNLGPAQKDERYSRQQPASHSKCSSGDSKSRLD